MDDVIMVVLNGNTLLLSLQAAWKKYSDNKVYYLNIFLNFENTLIIYINIAIIADVSQTFPKAMQKMLRITFRFSNQMYFSSKFSEEFRM